MVETVKNYYETSIEPEEKIEQTVELSGSAGIFDSLYKFLANPEYER
jgi:hypothetical protein